MFLNNTVINNLIWIPRRAEEAYVRAAARVLPYFRWNGVRAGSPSRLGSNRSNSGSVMLTLLATCDVIGSTELGIRHGKRVGPGGFEMRVRMGSSKQVGSVRVTFVRVGLERLTQRSTCAVLGYACTGL
ncbi:hypothetical protein Hanom_Chr03g00222331 [Helianthus anomalus]